jgi:D-glycero-alpha-D-manno-heptose-7-phosphate kinase
MIITKTPYRISLFGGGTDYPAWFENKPSRVVSAAIANYCYFTVKVLPPFFEHKNQVVYSKIDLENAVTTTNNGARTKENALAYRLRIARAF